MFICLFSLRLCYSVPLWPGKVTRTLRSSGKKDNYIQLVGEGIQLGHKHICTLREDKTFTKWLQLEARCHIKGPECKTTCLAKQMRLFPQVPTHHLFQAVFVLSPFGVEVLGEPFVTPPHLRNNHADVPYSLELDFFFNCCCLPVFTSFVKGGSGGWYSGRRHRCWLNQLLGEFLINNVTFFFPQKLILSKAFYIKGPSFSKNVISGWYLCLDLNPPFFFFFFFPWSYI